MLKREYRTIGGVEKTVEHVGFFYDGWYHVMTVRLNETNTPRGRVASYVWGPDVGSGYGEYAGHQKAGGVGGLCMVLDGANTNTDYPDSGVSNPDPTDDDYFPLMDRMGNVTGYRKAATTEAADSLSAVYEYDAFGQEIRSVGPASDKQPYRFSTKYTEGSTGLVYYGYRWYDAGKGRWVNRDPIGEEGGLNLYGFLSNNGVCQMDSYGLAVISIDQGKIVTSTPTDSQSSAPHTPRDFAVRASDATEAGSVKTIVENLEDAIREANRKCGCVRTLELVGEGSPAHLSIGAKGSSEEGTLDETATAITHLNAKEVGTILKQRVNFCKPCLIILSGCQTGRLKENLKNSWTKKLAAATGCTVRGYIGCVAGSHLGGDLTQEPNELNEHLNTPLVEKGLLWPPSTGYTDYTP